MYVEEFAIVDGTLLAAQVDARLCLSFVMPGCILHLAPMTSAERVAGSLLPPEDQQVQCRLAIDRLSRAIDSEQCAMQFQYAEETSGVKATIEIDDEENFGTRISGASFGAHLSGSRSED